MPNSDDLFGKPLRSKKGFALSYKMIMWVPRFIFTALVFFVTTFVVLSFIVTKTNVSEAESHLLMNYAYGSQNGVSFFDTGTDRVYQGVVNPSNFDSAHLSRLFAQDKPALVGRFVKRQVPIDYRISAKDPVVAYTDEARYKLWQPIAQLKSRGEGALTPYSEARYVATYDGGGAVVETVFIASS